MNDDRRSDSGVLPEVDPELQDLAAREQEIERVQDELDAAAIAHDAGTPVEQLGHTGHAGVSDLIDGRRPPV